MTHFRSEGGLRTKGIIKKTSQGNPLITIVTAIYNGEKYIDETIKSVLKQSYGNIEFIVIDGNSNDGTIEIIKKNEDVIDYWISEPDNGIYYAMNKGIQLASGKLINLLNADDYLENNAASTIAKKYSEVNHPCILYGSYYLVDEIIGYKTEIKSNLESWNGMPLSHQSMFVHENIYKTVGLYNTNYKLASDYDFFMRAVTKGVKFFDVNSTIVNYRLHGNSSKRNFLLKKETESIHMQYFGRKITVQIAFFKSCFLDLMKIAFKNIMYTVWGAKRAKYILMRINKILDKNCYDLAKDISS